MLVGLVTPRSDHPRADAAAFGRVNVLLGVHGR
jgi:hypothetical protein